MNFKLGASLVAITFLVSCGGSQEYKTDYQLCKGLAKYPSWNVNQKARKSEIAKRGVKCSKYSKQINKELAAEDLASAAAPKNYTRVQNVYEDNSTTYQPGPINDYGDLVCTNGRVMTPYGCRYR